MHALRTRRECVCWSWAVAICLSANCGPDQEQQPIAAPHVRSDAARVIATVERLVRAHPQLRMRFGAQAVGGFTREYEAAVSPAWRAAATGVMKGHLVTRTRLPLYADAAWEHSLGANKAFGVRLVSERAAHVPLELERERALYRSMAPSTDAVVVAGDTFTELAYVLRDEQAPLEFAWQVKLGSEVRELRAAVGGGLDFIDHAGAVRLCMPQPIAVDAAGRSVPVTLRFASNRLVLRVDAARENLTYPVFVDPAIDTVFWEKAPLIPAYSGHSMVTFDGKIVLPTSSGTQYDQGNDVWALKFDIFWEWDGTAWSLKALPTGPPSRNGAAIAVLGNKLILFGGNDGAKYLNDTWEWDGQTWTQKNPVTSPRPRAGHRIATLGTKLVLFGGTGIQTEAVGPQPEVTGPLTDTWEWDGTNWTEVNTSPPSDLYSYSMATLGNRIVLFNSAASNEAVHTWEWDGSVWTENFSSTKPSWIYGAVLATFDNQLVLFGGVRSLGLQETWVWDGADWIDKTGPTAPPPRETGAQMAQLGKKLVLFGGTSATNATWEWDGTEWKQAVSATSPNWLWKPMLATRANTVVLFGGSMSTQLFADTWEWNGRRWTEQKPATSPSARQSFSSAMATLADKVVMFGGVQDADEGPNYLGDTWEWDGANWTQRMPSQSPAARVGHAMATLGTNIVLFGGRSSTGLDLNDTWQWDGVAWTQLGAGVTPVPLERVAHVMATVGSKVTLFGGRRMVPISGHPIDPSLVDTWEWDGVAWLQRMPTLSPGFAGEAFMAALGPKLVLFGGGTHVSNANETWEWDGTLWTHRTPSQHPPNPAAMARLGDALVMFSGSETWIYRTEPPRVACDAVITCSSGVCLQGECVQLSQGLACDSNAHCATDFCVDGVCCNTSCGQGVTNDCNACSQSAGGATDGTCGPRISDPSCNGGQIDAGADSGLDSGGISPAPDAASVLDATTSDAVLDASIPLVDSSPSSEAGMVPAHDAGGSGGLVDAGGAPADASSAPDAGHVVDGGRLPRGFHHVCGVASVRSGQPSWAFGYTLCLLVLFWQRTRSRTTVSDSRRPAGLARGQAWSL